VHCVTGCAIGDVLGIVIGTALGVGNGATIALAVVLAFLFGCGLTMLPLLWNGMVFGTTISSALATNTTSIAIMEIADNAIVLRIPFAIDAVLASFLLCGKASGLSLAIAGAFARPVNRWLIIRKRDHAVVRAHHGHR
jgi:TctA family transporter